VAALWLFKPESLPGLTTILMNFTMAQRFLGFSHLDTVYWTLNVELSFYLWMFLAFKCGLIRRMNLLIAAALALQTLSAVAQHLSLVSPSQGVKAVLLLEYGHMFCAGMVFYDAWHTRFKPVHFVFLAWALVVQALVPFREFEWVPPSYYGTVALFLIFILMSFVVTEKMKWMVCAPALFLGGISYPFYLLHNQVGMSWMHYASLRGVPDWLGFLSAVGGVILLSWLVSISVERPAMKKIRTAYASYKGRAQPSPGGEMG
jgi:peptidoglycan/LPS O-acetylase OafA/YrhL